MADRVSQIVEGVIASGSPKALVSQVVEGVIASGPAQIHLSQISMCVIADVIPSPVKLPQVWVAAT